MRERNSDSPLVGGEAALHRLELVTADVNRLLSGAPGDARVGSRALWRELPQVPGQEHCAPRVPGAELGDQRGGLPRRPVGRGEPAR